MQQWDTGTPPSVPCVDPQHNSMIWCHCVTFWVSHTKPDKEEPVRRWLRPLLLKGAWVQCHGQASSRPPAHSAWMGMDNPSPCAPGSYLVLPVSGSTTLLMTLCLASHSSFVIGFIAWIRDFCSSVRTGMQCSVRAVLQERGTAPGLQPTDNIPHPIPGTALGTVTNHAKKGTLHLPKPGAALPGHYC